MIGCELSGAFAAHPEILWEFEDDPEMDEDLTYCILGPDLGPVRAEIVSASDEAIVYSDGFILRNPLKITGICESAMKKLMIYLEHALDRRREGYDGDPDDRTSQLLGDALDLWRENLEFWNDEYEYKKYTAKPKPDLDEAVAFARANRDVPMIIVADHCGVSYKRLALELRQRAVTES